MSTQILAAGTSAAFSTTFTVAVGAPVTVGLFVTGAGAIPYFSNALKVEIENPDLSFTDTSVSLDSTNPSALLIAPGNYRVERVAGNVDSVGVFRS